MTSETMMQISQYFWSESVWLPPGMNWSTIPQEQFTDFNVMYKSIPLAFVFLAIRIVFEWLATGVTIYSTLLNVQDDRPPTRQVSGLTRSGQ
jgi:hypothetical protein